MAIQVPITVNVRRRSAIAGRERWDVAGVLRQPLLAERLQAYLGEAEGIHKASANALTGRVLICFDPNVVRASAVGGLIVETLHQISEEVHLAEDGDLTVAPTGPGLWLEKIQNDDLLTLVRSVGYDRSVFWRATGISLTHTVLKIAAPMFLGLLISVSMSGSLAPLARLGLNTTLKQLVAMSALFLGVKSAESYAENRKKNAWNLYAQRIERSLRLQVFEHIQQLDMAYLEDQSTDRLMSLINTDTGKIKQFVDYSPQTLIEKSGTMILGSTLMLLIAPLALLLIFLPLPVIMYFNRRRHKESAAQHQSVAKQADAFNQLLANNLQGLATVKSFTAEVAEVQRLADTSQHLYENTISIARANTFLSSSVSYGFPLGISLPIIYGSISLLMGAMSFSTFMIIGMVAPVLLVATGGLDHAYAYYQDALQAARRLKELLSIEPRIVSGDTPLPTEDVRGEIRLHDVSFGYRETRVLEGVSLYVPANHTMAFVGPTGSGKTTITKLLLRFYDTDEGEITLDGHEIRKLNLQDLRQAIGLVSQDTYLFNGTIYENILYGRLDASFDEVVAASKAAQAFEFIDNLPDGFHTLIGERGMKLSGGQRQRIAIARTLLKNPPILIFDEATSSVDNETEAAIQKAIEQLGQDRTILIIAHRLSTVRQADCIYVLRDARFVERGTHQELLDMDGEYARLWYAQLEGPMLDEDVIDIES